MKVLCVKCNSTSHSKCPVLRSIFPSRESERESNFWQDMGYELTTVMGTRQLRLTILAESHEGEEEALGRLLKKIKSIPDDELSSYACRHSYEHTENCIYCGYKL